MSDYVENCWYVAAWDHELSADGLFARTVCDLPLVMWLDSRGRPVVLEDRCCHRGAPLSLGRREGDCVRCMYHGLKFDGSGACIEIPGIDTVPAKARVRSLPSVRISSTTSFSISSPGSDDASQVCAPFLMASKHR